MNEQTLIKSSINQFIEQENSTAQKARDPLSYKQVDKEIYKLLFLQKNYKKTIGTIDGFCDNHKGKITISEKILMTRRINYALCKLLKFQAAQEGEMELQELKIREQRSIQSIFQHHDLLNIYFTNMEKEPHDYSFLTTYEEGSGFQEKKHSIAYQLLNSYNIKDNDLNRMKEQFIRTPRYEKFDEICIKSFLENENFSLKFLQELDQFLISSIKILLNLHSIYKRQNKFKLSWVFLLEASRICTQIVHSWNPDIIDICAKVNQGLSVFYFESGRNHRAIQYVEDSIFLYAHEIRILNLSFNKRKKLQRKENKCYKQLVLALINLALYLEEIKDFKRLWETVQLAYFIVTNYMEHSDEVSKYFRHLYSTFMHKIDQYLVEEQELTLIAEQVLGEYCIQNLNKTQEPEKQWHQQLNEEIYDKSLNKFWNKQFNVKLPPKKIVLINQFYEIQKNKIQKKLPLNDPQCQKEEEEEKSDQSTKFDYQQYMIEESNNQKQKSNNISFSSQSDDFFNESFYKAQDQNKQIITTCSEYNSMLKQTRQITQPTNKLRRHGVGLGVDSKNNVLIDYPKKKYKQNTKISRTHKMFFPSNYKPKVITTNNYFIEKLDQNQKLPLETNPANINRQYFENLRKKEGYVQLDTHIKNIVGREIEKHKINIIPMDEVLWKAGGISKKELFDKKEFGYARKMVHFKKMEDCNQFPPEDLENKYLRFQKQVDALKISPNQEHKFADQLNTVILNKIRIQEDYIINQQRNKKKLLDIIFKNRMNKIFNDAGNLKIAYSNYQLEIQNKKYIDTVSSYQELKHSEKSIQTLQNLKKSKSYNQLNNQKKLEKADLDLQKIKNNNIRTLAFFSDYNKIEKKNLESQYQSCRVELGMKKSKKEETTYNNAFVSKFSKFRDSISFLGVTNTPSLYKEKYLNLGDVIIAKINSSKRRNQVSMEINLQKKL